MKYVVKTFLNAEELESFLNKERIQQEQIISLLHSNIYTLIYAKRG